MTQWQLRHRNSKKCQSVVHFRSCCLVFNMAGKSDKEDKVMQPSHSRSWSDLWICIQSGLNRSSSSHSSSNWSLSLKPGSLVVPPISCILSVKAGRVVMGLSNSTSCIKCWTPVRSNPAIHGEKSTSEEVNRSNDATMVLESTSIVVERSGFVCCDWLSASKLGVAT